MEWIDYVGFTMLAVATLALAACPLDSWRSNRALSLYLGAITAIVGAGFVVCRRMALAVS